MGRLLHYPIKEENFSLNCKLKTVLYITIYKSIALWKCLIPSEYMEGMKTKLFKEKLDDI